jgi:hypothetical protein
MDEDFPEQLFEFSDFRSYCEREGVTVREVEFAFADRLWENGEDDNGKL